MTTLLLQLTSEFRKVLVVSMGYGGQLSTKLYCVFNPFEDFLELSNELFPTNVFYVTPSTERHVILSDRSICTKFC